MSRLFGYYPRLARYSESFWILPQIGILSGHKIVTIEPPPKKLIDRVRDAIQVKHYSYKTEQSYISWIVRYILYHNKRHPQEMGSREIEEFLTHLAVERNVAASTQNQVLQSILFLYREVLRQELDLKVDAVRAKRSRYLPTVLSKNEVLAIISNLQETFAEGLISIDRIDTCQYGQPIFCYCLILLDFVTAKRSDKHFRRRSKELTNF